MSDLNSDSAECDDCDSIVDESLENLMLADLMLPMTNLLLMRDSVIAMMITGDVTMKVLLKIMMVFDPSFFSATQKFFQFHCSSLLDFMSLMMLLVYLNELLLNDPGKVINNGISVSFLHSKRTFL